MHYTCIPEPGTEASTVSLYREPSLDIPTATKAREDTDSKIDVEQPGATAEATGEPPEGIPSEPQVKPHAEPPAKRQDEPQSTPAAEPAEETVERFFERPEESVEDGQRGVAVEGEDERGRTAEALGFLGEQPPELTSSIAATTEPTEPSERPTPEPAETSARPAPAPDAGAGGRGVRLQTSEPSLVAGELSAAEAAAAATAAQAEGEQAARSLFGIASTPFQLTRALLGPAVHFRPPSTDTIPRCQQVGRVCSIHSQKDVYNSPK